jgi:ribosomal protein S14
MKKLLEKDKKLRLSIYESEKKHFILRSIFKNNNLFTLIRWNAFFKLKLLTSTNSKIKLIPRCINSINKKRFNKLTFFSRHIFLKLIRNGDISGIRKTSW